MTSTRAQAERRADRVAAMARSGRWGAVDAGAPPVARTPVPRHVYDVVASPGQTVRPAVAARFAASDHDLARVRIHANAAGDSSVRRLGALAFTFGSDIVIRTDRVGSHPLLAHELTHAVQQTGRGPVLQLQEDPEGTPEPEAADDDHDLRPATAPEGDAGSSPATEPAANEQPVPPATRDVEPDAIATVSTPGTASATPAPGSISAPVGRGGTNAAADVALVQNRLLALGLLPAADHTRERPEAQGAVAAAEIAATVAEVRLTATIAAIIAFQKPLGLRDGNISPGGPTWRALARLDADGYAASLKAWEERERRHQAAVVAPVTAPGTAPAVATTRSQVAADLLTRFGGGIGGDTAGLGAELAGRAVADAELIPAVLDRVTWLRRDDVAYALCQRMTDKQLAVLPIAVRDRLVAELAGGWSTDEEKAQIARLQPAGVASPKAAGPTPAAPGDAVARVPLRGGAAPVIDGATFDERVAQIRAFFDTYWVPWASTKNCHLATKAALEKLGYTVGGGDTSLFHTPIGDTPLSGEQEESLKAMILAEVAAGRPVEIGVDFEAGHPNNVDHKTDHWLYVVAVTHDDSGAVVLVAYDNANVAGSAITKGQVVFFRLDSMGRFQHPAYFPTLSERFSTEPHFVVNVRPVSVPHPK